MDTAWFGWGLPLLKRHWSLRWGECPHCGEADYRPSYDASKMAVAFGLPLLPLGKVHVHEDCAVCREGEVHGLAAWESMREERFIPALESFSQRENDPEAASAALEQTVALGEPEEFGRLAQMIEDAYSGNAEILSRLAWCHGHFARFDDARRLYRRALSLEASPDLEVISQAYEALPLTEPPRRPSAFFQGLRFLLLPLFVIVGATLFLSNALQQRVADVHVVNGLGWAYDVRINERTLTLEPFGRVELTLSPGPVRVAPGGSGFIFSPYRFELPAGRRSSAPTVVINPDEVAVISWEELVYQKADLPEPREANADQFVLHVGEGFYFFEDVTDAFEDPPSSLEMHSRDQEMYRHVIHHLGDEPPVSLCTLLLGQGEMDLAEDYCRRLLTLDPGETSLLPFLRELNPSEATLAFMEARLADRPARMLWHRHYVDLAIDLDHRSDVVRRYEDLVQADPESGMFHFLLGEAREDPDEARQDYRRAAERGSAEAHYELSLWRSAQGDFTEALAHVEKALQGQPENRAFLGEEEDLLLATGNHEELIRRQRERLDEDPLDQVAAMTLAGLLELKGEAATAQSVADRFVQAVALDGGELPAEARGAYETLFAEVRAQWVGDVPRFLGIRQGADDPDDLNSLILRQRYEEAAAAMEGATSDPFLHLLIYALARSEGARLALSEVQLSQALKLFENDPISGATMASWFRAGVASPSLADTCNVSLPNFHRRVLLFALAQRHPGNAGVFLPLAKTLNYNRVFPYLALVEALRSSE